MPPDIFHGDETADEILARAGEAWDLTAPLPLPLVTFTCLCGHDEWQARQWSFTERRTSPDHRLRYRCNVSMKCRRCGLVQTWGVVVPEERYVYATLTLRSHNFYWRDAEAILVDVV